MCPVEVGMPWRCEWGPAVSGGTGKHCFPAWVPEPGNGPALTTTAQGSGKTALYPHPGIANVMLED